MLLTRLCLGAGRGLHAHARALSSVCVLFPGQGSQRVGMGRAFLESSDHAQLRVRQAQEAMDAVAWARGHSAPPLIDCMLGHGGKNQSDLNQTETAQPAIFVHSMLAYEAVQSRVYDQLGGVERVYLLGHSLGEFSAACAAGVCLRV
jgi:[acyl-carrier-protein] S-malonyltransferase